MFCCRQLLLVVFCFCWGFADGAESAGAPAGGIAPKKLVLDNPFFAFDNGVGRGAWTPAEQAKVLKKLGYQGIMYSGCGDLEKRFSAFDAEGLRIFSLYVWSKIGPNGPSYDPNLKQAIRWIKGRNVMLSLTVQGKAPDGDAQAVKVVREIADLAKESGLKIALYPHLGFHVATFADGVRIAEKVDRENVGTTFNFCHWLKEKEKENFTAQLKAAMPKLFLVSINGADHEGGWDRLIQPLDRGAFDVYSVVKKLKQYGYNGPVGLQCYNVKGDAKENLTRSMNAWKKFAERMASEYPPPPPPRDTSGYGKHFQRSMTLMTTSTPARRNTVRLLFYGQSIVGQRWHTMVMDDLKRRFPHTDFVVKNKAIGGFGSQLLIRTLHYDLIPFYPDLLVFHVYGAHDKYEDIIREVRTRTTAEVIMQSDHANTWPEPKCTGNFWTKQKQWGDKMNYFLLPAIAEKYRCAWQPQRWEWVDYLKANNMQPKDLLTDTVHLNKQGRWLMAELLKRFLVYLPDAPRSEWEGMVTTYEVGKDVKWRDGQLKLSFDGNRVVALTGKGPGGKASVAIDGTSVSEHPECYTFTRPSGTPFIGWPAIKKITWKTPPVLETWEAVCSGFNDAHDEFTFTVKGSVTGPDGSGSAKETFVSESGRVVIEPEDWVFAFDRRVSKKRAPDDFKVTWKVALMGTDTYVSPEVKNPAKEYSTVLATNLENGRHVLVLEAEDGSAPPIKYIRVYKPPFLSK